MQWQQAWPFLNQGIWVHDQYNIFKYPTVVRGVVLHSLHLGLLRWFLVNLSSAELLFSMLCLAKRHLFPPGVVLRVEMAIAVPRDCFRGISYEVFFPWGYLRGLIWCPTWLSPWFDVVVLQDCLWSGCCNPPGLYLAWKKTFLPS